MLNVGIDSWGRDSLASRASGIWVADEDPNQVSAFLVSVSSASAVELLLVGTDPLRQRRGLGRVLLEVWLEAMPRPVWLEVHEANRVAIGLYRSLGFLEVGRRPRYYRDGGTAISMTLPAAVEG